MFIAMRVYGRLMGYDTNHFMAIERNIRRGDEDALSIDGLIRFFVLDIRLFVFLGTNI